MLPTNHQPDIDVFGSTSDEEKLTQSIAPGEIVLGTIAAINALGQPEVNFSLNPSEQALTAITTLALTQQQINRQVALLFNQGDLSQPIVIGLIHSPLQAMLDNFEASQKNTSPQLDEKSESVELAASLNIDNVNVEGKKVTFEAEDEMVFKCGESSITLTKAGKVMIRGKYLLNRSTGVNRILGGSVQVN
ncbi:hypothetical protein CXF85_09235 [Colwellia sp. 75C3]|uniref:DUF6484 domain-containing protein n=1 Tax=Colwellia sp. 75C3 TaxID=888425 RepID=UPI000C33D69F|nr:DUF6484 domain-containing protein [Colwellia sp. 75C3]PKG84093.1 hypothetical protein CXF85_09235 [Colwellia sp. 75C3]